MIKITKDLHVSVPEKTLRPHLPAHLLSDRFGVATLLKDLCISPFLAESRIA
jgi:hypothetical protein